VRQVGTGRHDHPKREDKADMSDLGRTQGFSETSSSDAGLSHMRFAPLCAEAARDAFLAHVNPEFRTFVAQIVPGMQSMPGLSSATLEQNRAQAHAAAQQPLPDVPWEPRTIAGAAGQPDVTVYVINATSGRAHPGLVHLHGGGFVSGSAKASLRAMQELSRALDITVMTVDYRLSPEVTFAQSIEDNYTALKWFHANAAPLGIDPQRIGVLGESAGGGHAALLAIAARDRGEIPLVFQCLIYPMLDDRTGSTRSVAPFTGQIVWTADANRFGWESFLGMPPGGSEVPVSAVPSRTSSLAGLPPTFIGVGSIDLFCSEDVEYARRLVEAGVATELIVIPGAFHDFDLVPVPTKIVPWFNAAKLEALRRGLQITRPDSAEDTLDAARPAEAMAPPQQALQR
jgi:acetyl esterase/lipase